MKNKPSQGKKGHRALTGPGGPWKRAPGLSREITIITDVQTIVVMVAKIGLILKKKGLIILYCTLELERRIL